MASTNSGSDSCELCLLNISPKPSSLGPSLAYFSGTSMSSATSGSRRKIHCFEY
jgi:hypothetical protein